MPRAANRAISGRVAIGIGLMLLALRVIVSASAPLRDSELLSQIVGPIAGEPLLALLIAALVTWLTHSSLAVVLLVMSLAQGGVAPIGLALVLVLGANIGGAMAPMTTLMGEANAVRRVPIANAFMRFIGAVALLAFVPALLPYSRRYRRRSGAHGCQFSYCVQSLAGSGLSAAPWAPGQGPATKLFRDADPDSCEREVKYLNSADLGEPAVALANAARETLRMGDVVAEMLAKSIRRLPP